MTILEEILKNSGNQKVKINTPSNILNKINGLIKLKDKNIKILKEVKGILVGKYPNKQALVNSIKGLKKKIENLNEAKEVNEFKKALLILLTTLTIGIASGTVGIAAGKKFNKSPEIKQSILQQYDVTTKDIIHVDVNKEEWKRIEIAIDNLYATKIAQLKTLEDIVYFNKVLKQFDIKLSKFENTDLVGTIAAYDWDLDEVLISLDYLKKLNKVNPNSALFKIIVRHEKTHQQQFIKIPNELMKQDFFNQSYVNRKSEIGAYRNGILQMMENKKLSGHKAYEVYKYALDLMPEGMMKNIIRDFGKDDKVVKYVLKINPNYGKE